MSHAKTLFLVLILSARELQNHSKWTSQGPFWVALEPLGHLGALRWHGDGPSGALGSLLDAQNLEKTLEKQGFSKNLTFFMILNRMRKQRQTEPLMQVKLQFCVFSVPGKCD